jgi:hypothetical protein
MVRRILAHLCATLSMVLFSVMCHAQEQNNISINVRVGISQGLGYENPRLGVETSLREMASKRLGFAFSANVDSARKKPGGGVNEAVQGTVRLYKHDWFIGGGLAANHQTTSLYAKTAASPLIELGFIRKEMTVRLYVEPYDFASVNHSNAFGFSLDYYAPTQKSYGWKMGFNSRIARFGCFQGAHGLTSSCVGGSASFSFGVYKKLKRPVE